MLISPAHCPLLSLAAFLLTLRAMASPPAPLPYLLRIGITGHRSLSDEAAVAAAVERLLDRIEHTLSAATTGSVERQTSLDWLVVSPLAKGADRLAARAVLKRPQARLSVVTPFPLQEYRKDFDEPGDAAEFEDLLRHDPAPLELEAPGAAADAAARNEAYFRVGKAVVDQCELLIAVWNGELAAGRGGTGDVVQYAVDRGRTVLWIHSQHPEQPARMIVPEPEAKPADGPLPATAVRPLPPSARELVLNFHQLAAYNRDAGFDASEYEAILERNESALRTHARKANLDNSALDCLLPALWPDYARADQLATRYQRLYTRAAVVLYMLAATAVSIATVQVLFFPQQLWLIAFEVAAMLAAVVLWQFSRRQAWHEKWLHDRHLAERVRSTFFMSLLGTAHAETADRVQQLLAFYRGPDSWVREAHARLLARATACPAPASLFESLRRFVIDGWIADQARWHADNAARKERAARWSRLGSMALFVTTLVMATLHLAGVGHEGHGPAESYILGNAITSLAIVLPAWGAAVHAINVLRDRERIAARSRRMATVLSQIAERAERAVALDALRIQAAAAEEVMAAENLEWWASLSFRELELPT